MWTRSLSRLLPLVVLALVPGCSDRPAATAPSDDPALEPLSNIIVHNVSPDQTSADFTVTTSGGYFQLGAHGIFFPANVICDPETSTYGITEWDKPCDVAQRPIQIHAEIRSANGVSWVDFTPALRFAPSHSPMRWVWLYMYVGQGYDPNGQILWFPHVGADPVDESRTDATLRTRYYEPYGLAYRRIKHFSGYQAGDGRTCDPNVSTCDSGLDSGME